MNKESIKEYVINAFERVMKNPKAVIGGAITALSLAYFVAGSIHKTGTTEIGVRTRKVSLFNKKGVEQRIYQPGSTYFFPPLINDWTTYDTKLVNVEMNADTNEGNVGVSDDLAFKTRDGNDINLDVVFSYRIDPEKAPQILQYVASSSDELENKIFWAVARSKPRDIFGELSSEEFYQAEKRNESAEKAKKELEKILQPYGVIIEKVAPKDYRFNPRYAEAIKDKKLADAKTLEYLSQTNAQKEENVRLLREAEGSVNEMIAKVDGAYKQAVLEADAYYNQQQKIAEAIIAEGQAEAKAIKAAREAMTSTGGSTLVKMKIAENLKGKKIIMVPTGSQSGGGINFQTLNVNDFLKTYGAKTLADEAEQSTATHKNK